MAREPIPLHAFALVIVRQSDRFLLVEERDGEWYFPAGRVDPGETIVEAALRETMEEAGLAVRVTGLYRLEHRPSERGTRIRVFFAAAPVDERAPPKSARDHHSRGAAWLTLDQIRDGRPLRGDEVRDVLEAVARGAVVHPLELLVEENRGWSR